MPQKLSGLAVLTVCSPPLTAFGGSATPHGDPQVYRWCSTDAAGTLTAYTNFNNFTVADECYNPVLSPDTTQILFEVLSSTTGFYEIWVTNNIPGSTPTQIVADASNYVFHPFWGSDSNTFVYIACTGGVSNNGSVMLDTVSSPGSPTTLKTPTAGWGCYRPTFNAAGTRVAYIMDKNIGAGCDLRTMNSDGSGDAAIDSTLSNIRINQPAQLSYSTTGADMICYENGANAAYVINDDGSFRTQINTAGVASGLSMRVSAFAWPPGDGYVILTTVTGVPDVAHLGLIRAELDGSNTTQLNASHGPVNQLNAFQSAIVFNSRIWFIENTDASLAGHGQLSSTALDGTDYQLHFDSSTGAGTAIQAFGLTGGDGFYFQ